MLKIQYITSNGLLGEELHKQKIISNRESERYNKEVNHNNKFCKEIKTELERKITSKEN